MRTPDEIHDLDETLFELGDIIITSGALEKLIALNVPPIALIGLHVSGMVSSLVYYSDTHAFFDTFYYDIMEIVEDLSNE